MPGNNSDMKEEWDEGVNELGLAGMVQDTRTYFFPQNCRIGSQGVIPYTVRTVKR